MSLCIFAMATKKYLRYMPLFTYFCFKSYPKCGVRILLSNCKPDHGYDEFAKDLGRMGNLEMRIVAGYPQTNRDESRVLRWMMDEGFFKPYENIYITDIDILICRERVSLEKRHLEHCKRTKLPYSNIVRPNSQRLAGGMHFFRRKEYYESTANVIVKYSKLLRKGKLKDCRDEEILYKIIMESGLQFPTKSFHSHHGLHLGLWKAEKEGKVLKAIRDGTTSILLADYRRYFEFYRTFKHDPLFKQMNEDCSLEVSKRMEKWFNLF